MQYKYPLLRPFKSLRLDVQNMARPIPNLNVQYNPYLPGILQSTGYYQDNLDPRSFQSWPPSFPYSLTQEPNSATPSGQQAPTPILLSPSQPQPQLQSCDFVAQPDGNLSQTEQEYPLQRRNAMRANAGSPALIERAREAKIRSLRKRYGDIAGHQVEYWGS